MPFLALITPLSGMPDGPVDPGWGVTPPVDPGYGRPSWGGGPHPSHPIARPPSGPVDPGWGYRPPVDPGYGRPGWGPVDPGWGNRPPVDPGWGGGWGGGNYPSHGLPGAPGHPSHPIAIPVPPPAGGGQPIPPEWTKPSTPPEYVVIWVPGYGWITAPVGQPPTTKPVEPAEPK